MCVVMSVDVMCQALGNRERSLKSYRLFASVVFKLARVHVLPLERVLPEASLNTTNTVLQKRAYDLQDQSKAVESKF